MRMLLKQEKMYAYVYEGQRYDTGDKLGFLKATVEFALKRQDLGGRLVAAGEIVVNKRIVAGFFKALDGVRPNITSAACDEDVHAERNTPNASERIGEII